MKHDFVYWTYAPGPHFRCWKCGRRSGPSKMEDLVSSLGMHYTRWFVDEYPAEVCQWKEGEK